MNDNPKFKFNYNGVTYTVTIGNLSDVLRRFDQQVTEDILEKDSDFAEAKAVIARIKEKL